MGTCCGTRAANAVMTPSAIAAPNANLPPILMASNNLGPGLIPGQPTAHVFSSGFVNQMPPA